MVDGGRLTLQFGVENFYMRAGTCLKTRAQGPYCVQGKLLCPRTHFLAHTKGPQTRSKGPVQGAAGGHYKCRVLIK